LLPQFTSDGFLPAGLHHASWSEFIARFGGGKRRTQLINLGLQQLLNLLAMAGCTEVRLGGSFVTSKETPGDFDGIWMLAGVDEKKLPLEVFASVGAQADIFGGSLVPEDWQYTDIGILSKALETNRAGVKVGIVVLTPQEVPLTQPLDRYRHFFAMPPCGTRVSSGDAR
jgi:hypothetical protein